jgi:transposase
MVSADPRLIFLASSKLGSRFRLGGSRSDLAEWLEHAGITTIAMESTGVYWIPAFEILEARGFEVFLVNAREAKQVPERKTDINDAQWLQKLHQYGLLRASFRPHHDIAALRAYLRQRERLLEFCASHTQHMQKALMQMNLQLQHVVADVTARPRLIAMAIPIIRMEVLLK